MSQDKWPKGKLALIRWVDTAHWERWGQESEWTDRSPIDCETIAWVIPSKEKAVVCFGTRTDDGGLGDRRVIPKGCIEEIRYLEGVDADTKASK